MRRVNRTEQQRRIERLQAIVKREKNAVQRRKNRLTDRARN
jgi:hypothetical protein